MSVILFAPTITLILVLTNFLIGAEIHRFFGVKDSNRAMEIG